MHTLQLTDDERNELLTVLEREMELTRVEARRTDERRYRAAVEQELELLRTLLGKVRTI